LSILIFRPDILPLTSRQSMPLSEQGICLNRSGLAQQNNESDPVHSILPHHNKESVHKKHLGSVPRKAIALLSLPCNLSFLAFLAHKVHDQSMSMFFGSMETFCHSDR